MSGRIHRYRWQLCAGTEGGCAQAAENRYGTQPPDDAPFPESVGVEEGASEGWKLSDFNYEVDHRDERRVLARVDNPKTSRVFEEDN